MGQGQDGCSHVLRFLICKVSCRIHRLAGRRSGASLLLAALYHVRPFTASSNTTASSRATVHETFRQREALVNVNNVAIPGLPSGPPCCVSDAGKIGIVEYIANVKLSK